MALTRAAVLQNIADLGIVFDTDVDRSGVVDNKDNPLTQSMGISSLHSCQPLY